MNAQEAINIYIENIPEHWLKHIEKINKQIKVSAMDLETATYLEIDTSDTGLREYIHSRYRYLGFIVYVSERTETKYVKVHETQDVKDGWFGSKEIEVPYERRTEHVTGLHVNIDWSYDSLDSANKPRVLHKYSSSSSDGSFVGGLALGALLF